MAYETVKQVLRQATTPDARADAIDAAMEAGMPLAQIEQYLDWLDQEAQLDSRAP